MSSALGTGKSCHSSCEVGKIREGSVPALNHGRGPGAAMAGGWGWWVSVQCLQGQRDEQPSHLLPSAV